MARIDGPTTASTAPLTMAVFLAAVLLAAGIGLGVGRGDPPTLMLLGLVGLGAGVLAAHAPVLGLIALTVVTFANLSEVLIRFHGLPSLNKLIAPGLMFILGYRFLILGERPFFDRTVVALMLIFMLLIVLGAQVATRYGVALSELDDTARNIVIVLLALAFFRHRGSLVAFSGTLAACGLAIGALAALKYSPLGDLNDPYWGLARSLYGHHRFTGPEADPNGFGAMLVIMLPFAVDRALWGASRGAQAFGLAAAALIALMVMLTQSRGALVAVMASGGLYALTLDRRTATRLAAGGAVAVLAAGAILSEEVIARFGSILEMAESGGAVVDSAVQGRLGSWTVALHLFLENPILGVGPGNFNVLYQDTANELGLIFRGADRSPHSLYLEILSEYGLVGFTLFAIAIALAVRGVLTAMAQAQARGALRMRALCAAFGMALAGHLAAMAFLHGPGARPLWILLAVGIALPRILAMELAQPRRPGAAPPRQPAGSAGAPGSTRGSRPPRSTELPANEVR